jgi:hypothetical protein
MSIVIVLCVFRIYPFGFSLPTSHPCTFAAFAVFFLLWVNGHASGAPPIQLLSRRRHRLGETEKILSQWPQCPRSNSIACSYCSAIALVESEVHAGEGPIKKAKMQL